MEEKLLCIPSMNEPTKPAKMSRAHNKDDENKANKKDQ